MLGWFDSRAIRYSSKNEEYYAEKSGNIPINLAGTPLMVVQNRLLAAMASETFDHLRPRLQPIALKRGAILQEYDRRIEHIYFIERGLASVFARTKRDGPVEVSIVGRFGFVGVAAVLGIMRSPIRCWM